jgi:hypothetical protein
MGAVPKANISPLYRKSYDKEARLQQMRTMGASANPKVVKRMLEIAKTIDPEHYKAMVLARREATGTPGLVTKLMRRTTR